MQGEGQEFESPRLHHPFAAGAGHNRRARDHPRQTSDPSGPIERARHRAPDPCPAARRQATDQRIAGDDRFTSIVGGPPCGPAPLQLDSVRQKRRNLRFRRVKSRKSDPEIPSVDGRLVRGWRGSSYKGHGVDALAPRADEGRGRLRKASGSREQTVIRRCPNGETRLGSCPVTPG